MKAGICELYFGYNPELEGYANPSSHITKLYEIIDEVNKKKKGIGHYIFKKTLRVTNMANITDNRKTLGFELKQWQMQW